MRFNPHKTGSAFENALAQTMAAYLSAGIAKLEKVEAPTKTMGGGKSARKTIYLHNPFLDFTGVWTANHGRALMIEAKSTLEPRLPIGHGGITDKQLKHAFAWQAAGAAVAFIWEHKTETRLITPAMVKMHSLSRKSVRWIDAHKIPQGSGFIFIDFLSLLEMLYPKY